MRRTTAQVVAAAFGAAVRQPISQMLLLEGRGTRDVAREEMGRGL